MGLPSASRENDMDESVAIEAAIQAKGLNAPRIHPKEIEKLMERVQYKTIVPEGTTSTLVHAFLDGRFLLGSGHSACVSPENFNADIGRSIAMSEATQAAADKLWELEGYRLYQGMRDKPEGEAEDVIQMGDQVFFYEKSDDQISHPMVALVAAVWDPSTVSLTILAANGTAHARTKVTLLERGQNPSPDMTMFARRK